MQSRLMLIRTSFGREMIVGFRDRKRFLVIENVLVNYKVWGSGHFKVQGESDEFGNF